jgi:hypothetical protein
MLSADCFYSVFKELLVPIAGDLPLIMTCFVRLVKEEFGSYLSVRCRKIERHTCDKGVSYARSAALRAGLRREEVVLLPVG